MINNRRISILGANILNLIIALLLISLGSIVQGKDIHTGLLITEYLIVLSPVLLYIRFKGYSIKDIIKFNRISIKQFILVVLIAIFSYPVAVFFNFIGIAILSRLDVLTVNPVPIPSTPRGLLLGFFIIALTPGICEEIMFRGMIMNSYERLGAKKAIFYSAFLFGLFHFNIQNLLGPIFLGIIFGILMLKTDSIFSTIIAHTVNNSIALILGYKLNDLGNIEYEAESTSVALSGDSIIYGLITLAVMAIIFGTIVSKLIRALPSTRRSYPREKMTSGERRPIWLFILIFIFWNYRIFFI